MHTVQTMSGCTQHAAQQQIDIIDICDFLKRLLIIFLPNQKKKKNISASEEKPTVTILHGYSAADMLSQSEVYTSYIQPIFD